MGGDRRGRAGAGDGNEAVRSDRGRLEQHEVGVGHGRAEPGHRDVDDVHVRMQQPAHEPAALAEGVDHEHVEIASARQRLADAIGPAEHAHGRVLGQRVRQ